MLAASAAGMSGEAAAAIAAVVARALVLLPTRAGVRREADRFEWFASTRSALQSAGQRKRRGER